MATPRLHPADIAATPHGEVEREYQIGLHCPDSLRRWTAAEFCSTKSRRPSSK